ncbi:MAG TPA: hypothetical protein PK605_08930 [Ignavibacteria bacterium]|nr:hypothetical protein [Bacteroidota bacterium]HRE11150.1 hypothetical protein [Ignavibacteria bacterium]HRF65870.1 hypothetical protein [Ignavibacteria bacterium]HRJ04510.1 hypothetical protein [Ignavibacteria bacterium]HRJ86312.1 hypothetical protein [Ignavibacteria bacterium]
MKNTINHIRFSIIFLLILIPVVSYPQDQDSLLEKIRNIDVTLNEAPDSEENLYMNTVSFQSFYDILSPMGEWIQITKEDIDEDLSDGEGEGRFSASYYDDESYLFIWRPNVSEDWKPYSRGKWEYTDHGWLWTSSDSWGNSTYNYGRWWNSPKYGWVWLPGYTWAPAWVRWKVTGDDNFIGWVPLTPKAKWKSETGITDNNYRYTNKEADWVFVDAVTFTGDITPGGVKNASENSALMKSSTNITDIKVEDDRIITGGPDVNRIEEKTGKKFGRKKLRFSKGNKNTVIGENDVTVPRETFDRSKGEKFQKGKPDKFRKSEKIRKNIRKKKPRNTPPPNRNR